MPDPRTIAKQKNEAGKFAAEDGYDAEAGVPAGVSPGRAGADHAPANPVNPPEPAAPARNLKG